MSESNGSKDEFTNEGNPDFFIRYDCQPPPMATRMRIEFNLDSFSENPHGTALVRGLGQELVNEILLVIKAKRQTKAAGGVLTSSGLKLV